MKLLLDESVPVQVRAAFPGQVVSTVSGLGWKGLENGDLLAAAEAAGFDVFIIADKNLRYQQNLIAYRMAIVELWTNHRPTLERHFSYIANAVGGAAAGNYVELPSP